MATITNGQIVGAEAIRYNCGFGGFESCYDRYTYRVRRYKKKLVITFTNDSQRGWGEERVCDESWVLNTDARNAFSPEFRQSPLWAYLAKQSFLSAEKIGDNNTRLSSTYLEDNETVLTPALLDGTPTTGTGSGTGDSGTGNGTGTGNGNGGGGNGLTLDQVLPYIAGGVILLGLVLILTLSRRR